MSTLPASIPFSRVREFFESLGIPVEHTVSVVFGVDSLSVEQVRIDPGSGKMLAAGRDLATVTTIIGYDREGVA